MKFSLYLMIFLLSSIFVESCSQKTITEPKPRTWDLCARETKDCKFTGTKLVRYGANDKYTYKIISDGISCSNKVFGDPVPGIVKNCHLSD